MFILFTDIDGTITNKYTHAFEGSDVWLKKLNKLGTTEYQSTVYFRKWKCYCPSEKST